MRPTAVRLAAYRLLLRLLRGSLRRRSGAEMERLFVEMCAEPRSGILAEMAFWARLVWDTASQGVGGRLPDPSLRHPRLGDTMFSLLHDVRSGIRSAVRRPQHALFIVLLMTISIAANAVVFPLFNGFLLRPLPFDEPGQLVDLDVTAPQWNLDYVHVNYDEFAPWRRSNATFAGMAMYVTGGSNFSHPASGESERITQLGVTHDLADVLRIEPTLGRFFLAAEDDPESAPVAVLSEAFWRRQFSADPGAVGQSILINSVAREVIGVLPARASLLADADVWLPLGFREDGNNSWNSKAIGRLLPGATIEQARADLLRVHRAGVEQRPVNEITTPVVNSFATRYLGDYQALSWVLLAAVGIVLVISCANIAGLMMAQALSRSQEIATRLALGARPGRIVRQILVESVMLAAAGAAVGGAVGVWGFRVFVLSRPELFPRWVTFDLDWRFFAYTLLATGGAAVAFGLLPALPAARRSTGLSLAGNRTSGSRTTRRAMNSLVSLEVAMAVLLLVVAGFGLQDFWRLQDVDPGYEADGLLTYKLFVTGERFETGDHYRAFVNEHVERLRSLPGVIGAAAVSHLPLDSEWGWFFVVEGAPPRPEGEASPVVQHKVVTPGYFETMGIEVVAGRSFHEFDGREDGTRVAIVNEAFVGEFFPDDPNPIGRRIGDGSEGQWKTVVGVTRDVRHRGMAVETRPGVYQPMSQYWLSRMSYAVRTAEEPTALISAVRATVREMDATLPIYDLRTMRERVADDLWSRWGAAAMIVAFSIVALLLSATGLYGMVSYSVRQRFHELGIRLALGAERGALVRQVLVQGMTQVAVGVVGGGLASLLAWRVIASALVSGAAASPGVFLAVLTVVVAVSILANLGPAMRAAAVEPVRALRGES